MKLPYHWQFDYMLKREGEVSAFAELKCRTHDHDDFPTIILSDHKARWAFWCVKHLYKTNGEPIPFIYFLRFNDKDVWGKIEEEEFMKLERVLFKAKNHASDPRDVEYIRYVPLENFKSF